ncbi:MAG: hypothetical protein GY928_39785, partial [Colwellia sp.]|nr:hypothetical protein [Colwellia sp.]
MNYTKQQLEAPLGEVIMKGLTLTELENPLEWKKWRVVKHKSVKANQ